MSNASQEDPAGWIFGDDREALAEASLGGVPVLFAIGGKRAGKGVAQYEALGADLALTAE